MFGEGAARVRLVLVGEQPGNDEDLASRPFVGPAGRLRDRALAATGIRAFRYLRDKRGEALQVGGARQAAPPHEADRARNWARLPWLREGSELIRPAVVVARGAAAAQSLLANDFRVSIDRGKIVTAAFAEHILATLHPSSILRLPLDVDRHREIRRFIGDLQVAASLLNGSRPV